MATASQGRKLKLISGVDGHVSNEDKEKREQAENAMSDFIEIDEKPPVYLDTLAKKTYKKLAPQLKKLPIKQLDQGMLEQYCQFYSIYVQAVKDIKKTGIKTADGNHKNPAFSVMNDSAASMRRCAGELGLTVDSRLRLLIPKEDDQEDDFFSKFGSGN